LSVTRGGIISVEGCGKGQLEATKAFRPSAVPEPLTLNIPTQAKIAIESAARHDSV